jgi:glycosyltransferase involved in cell wall biosynthesis
MVPRARVLWLIDTLCCGGRERQFAELLRGIITQKRMAPSDLAVLLMGDDGHFAPVIEQLGVPIVRLRRRCRWDPWVVVRLSRLLQRMRPQVLCSFSEMATCYSALAWKPAGTRLVDASLRNALPLRSVKERLLGWINYRAACRVVANSRAGLAAKGAPRAKGRVLYNGFDFQRLTRLTPAAEIRGSLGINTPHVVGMLGTFSRYKDWDTFLEAARLVRRQRDDVTFVAVGGGDLLEDYRRRWAQEPGVVFTGRLRHIESLVAALDVGVLCSSPQHAREGIPNAVMEYMALAVPAVATGGGGVAELVRDEQTGFIVEPAHPEAVAVSVLWLLDHPEAARQMGERGRRRLEAEFSIARAVNTLMEILDDAAGEGLARADHVVSAH